MLSERGCLVTVTIEMTLSCALLISHCQEGRTKEIIKKKNFNLNLPSQSSLVDTNTFFNHKLILILVYNRI